MQSSKNEISALHTACVTDKAVCPKTLLEEIKLRVEKAAQRKKIKKLTRLLRMELLA